MRLLRLSPAEALLRIGVAFSFLYPPINALFDPMAWLGYFPSFATDAFHIISIPLKLSDTALLHAFGIVEIALAIWILIGRDVRIPSYIAAALLLTIVGFNLDPSNFSVLFRDISIALAALALAFMQKPNAS